MQAALIATYKKCLNSFRDPQLFRVMLFSFAIIIGQVLPMQAGYLGLGGSEFIEICGGEDGSYIIEVSQNSEDSDKGHDCNDCSLCTVSWNGANAVPAAGGDISRLSVAEELAFSPDYTVFTDCPEKHWSTSRAPPIASIKINTDIRNSFFLNRLYSEYFEDAQKNRVGIS